MWRQKTLGKVGAGAFSEIECEERRAYYDNDAVMECIQFLVKFDLALFSEKNMKKDEQ